MSRHRISDLADVRALFPDAGEEKEQHVENACEDRATSLVKLHVQLEKKGRKGKGVTLIKGFFHTEEDLRSFARELKSRCGSGGTVKDNSIEIQGDHRSVAVQYFRKKGFRVTGGE